MRKGSKANTVRASDSAAQAAARSGGRAPAAAVARGWDAHRHFGAQEFIRAFNGHRHPEGATTSAQV